MNLLFVLRSTHASRKIAGRGCAVWAASVPRFKEKLMKRLTTLGVALVFALGLSVIAQAGWDPNAENEARDTIARFKEADPDLKAFFDKAHGYAVFPTVGKAGMGIGGAYGKGTVFEGGEAIGSASMKQLTIGLQLGGQTYSEIIFFEDEKALDDFKQGNFELGAQASAVAVTKGASADADFDNGVAVFTLAKGGLMAEASVGGQKFSFEPK
jgi:lipid-binding SYLF domain-containing protein